MKAQFTKYGPAFDYSGAHVIDSEGKLAEIVSVYQKDLTSSVTITMARLKTFYGEMAGEEALCALEILERDYPVNTDVAVQMAGEEAAR